MKSTILGIIVISCLSASLNPFPWNFDEQRNAYFKWQVDLLEKNTDLLNWSNPKEFRQKQDTARKELYEMLGLSPLPTRTPLNVVQTGVIEHDSFIVEKIYFESIPGLYVTANLYRPKIIKSRLPAILYVCGHASVKVGNYNFGSKAHYQHHPAWYAKNGYICIIVDTLQLGEIEGIHHGTYRYDRWWWLSRGYTPAGVEAWNGIRAIDYLLQRSDVDEKKIGVTGRSGGGGASWYIGALDERVQVIAPVAGVTDMHDQIVNACVAKHCDCMFFHNIKHWDFSKLGLLIAPRPLLIANSDRDPLFPLDGVYRVYSQIKGIYGKLELEEHLALNIVGGGHQDIQDIQVPTFRWFNAFLHGHRNTIDARTPKYFKPEQLRVYDEIPSDQINTSVDRIFVRKEATGSEIGTNDFEINEKRWMHDLDNKIFKSWQHLEREPKLTLVDSLEQKDISLTIYELQTDRTTKLPLLVLDNDRNSKDRNTLVKILDDDNWKQMGGALFSIFPELSFLSAQNTQVDPNQLIEVHKNTTLILLPMRGAGPSKYSGDQNDQIQIRRAYALLGQTLEQMQTWDIIQGLVTLKSLFPGKVTMEAKGETATMVIYASLYNFENQLNLEEPVPTHDMGVPYPSVLKYLDVPAAIAMSARRNNVHISGLSNPTRNALSNIDNHPSFHLSFD